MLHDIGKGSGDDHTKVGSRISSKVLKRLNENNSTIIEVHNRPSYIKLISNNIKNKILTLYFHNDTLSMDGSQPVD